LHTSPHSTLEVALIVVVNSNVGSDHLLIPRTLSEELYSTMSNSEIPIRSKKEVSTLQNMAGIQSYKLGDWKLQSGQSIPDAQIAYKTFGDPKSPAIIYPSWYSGGELALIPHELS
jgi:hypothetical protein